LLSFFILLAISSYAFDLKNYQILSIREICRSDFLKNLENLEKEKRDEFIFKNFDPNVVVKFEKGEKFPLKLFLKGEFFYLAEHNCPILVMKKDLYIRIKDEKFLFSDDLKSWKEVPEFFEGDAGIEVGVDKEVVQITVGAKLNKK